MTTLTHPYITAPHSQIPKCYALIRMSWELLRDPPPPTLTMKIPITYSDGRVGGDGD